MNVTITCENCGSGIHVIPDQKASQAKCDICEHLVDVNFTAQDEASNLCQCPVCSRKDFYQQKDFNRKIGVALFVIAAIASIWTYGLSLVALWLVDLVLFKKLGNIAICYKCQTIFRKVANIDEIRPFDHEMNDRVIYADHDFDGKPLSH